MPRLAVGTLSGHQVAIEITHDDKTFTLRGRDWFGTYPLEDLEKWLNFYRRQREDFPKAQGVYDATIEGLEALSKKLDQTRSRFGTE